MRYVPSDNVTYIVGAWYGKTTISAFSDPNDQVNHTQKTRTLNMIEDSANMLDEIKLHTGTANVENEIGTYITSICATTRTTRSSKN